MLSTLAETECVVFIAYVPTTHTNNAHIIYRNTFSHLVTAF